MRSGSYTGRGRWARYGSAKFSVGQVVRHRVYPFRGIVFDIDPMFNNTEEWWLSIPAEMRPQKDQPFYHLLAENARDRIHRLRLRAEPAARRDRPAAAPPAGQRAVHARTRTAAIARCSCSSRTDDTTNRAKAKDRPADRAERPSLSICAVEDAAYFFAAGAAAGAAPAAPGGCGGSSSSVCLVLLDQLLLTLRDLLHQLPCAPRRTACCRPARRQRPRRSRRAARGSRSAAPPALMAKTTRPPPVFSRSMSSGGGLHLGRAAGGMAQRVARARSAFRVLVSSIFSFFCTFSHCSLG